MVGKRATSTIPSISHRAKDGQVSVAETRNPGEGETEEPVTSAVALADAMFEVMDQFGEVEGQGC